MGNQALSQQRPPSGPPLLNLNLGVWGIGGASWLGIQGTQLLETQVHPGLQSLQLSRAGPGQVQALGLWAAHIRVWVCRPPCLLTHRLRLLVADRQIRQPDWYFSMHAAGPYTCCTMPSQWDGGPSRVFSYGASPSLSPWGTWPSKLNSLLPTWGGGSC